MTSRSHPRTRFLRCAADRRTLALLVASSAVYVLHWWSGVNSHGLVILCAVLAASACVVKHNHIHATTFRQPSLNCVLNVWLALLTGTSTTGIRLAHNQRHHRTNQSPEDFVRCSLVHRWPAFPALLGFFPLVVIQTWLHGRADSLRLRRKSVLLHRLRQMEQAAVWILIGTASIIDVHRALWVFAIPWAFGQWFLVTINLFQHEGLDARDPAFDSRNVSGRWSNWIFFNNGYHTAHHLRPALHWSQLPAFHHRELATQLPIELQSESLPGLVLNWLKTRTSPVTVSPVAASVPPA